MGNQFKYLKYHVDWMLSTSLLHTRWDELDIPLFQSIIHDGLIFLHHDRTSGVDDVTARAAVGVNGIDGGEE